MKKDRKREYASYPPKGEIDSSAAREGNAVRSQAEMGNLAGKHRSTTKNVKELGDEAKQDAANKLVVPESPRDSFRRTGE